MKERRITMKSHLAELRTRLTWSAAVVLICTALSFAFHGDVLTLLMKPAEGFAGVPAQKPIYTELTEFIGVAIKVSLLAGLILSLPFILFQIAMFVSPGLTSSERRLVLALIPVCLLVFLLGAAFGYRVLFPPAVHFLLSFGSEVATPYIRIGNYANLMITLLFWMGIVFETPVVMFFLSKIGLVTPSFLGRNRRYAVVVAFILGALITPTFDPINQTIVALPIIVLYEAGVWLAKLGGRGRRNTSKDLELDT